MRRIEPTGAFRRDFKRTLSMPRHRDLNDLLPPILQLLASDTALPQRNRDHALAGSWADHRECHLKPDLLLIYAKPDDETLRLIRLGSHSELFGK